MLKIKSLSVFFVNGEESTEAVKNFSCKVERGEVVGLLGESGSGKSTIGHAILGILNKSAIKITGEILIDGANLLELNDRDLLEYRGKKISIVLQDPFSSLNPVFNIGDQIIETILCHRKVTKKEAKIEAIRLLKEVGLNEKLIYSYPHQLSGGMRQRVAIAIAISSSPDFIIADEITTALDSDTQNEIISLLQRLQEIKKFGLLFITHNFNIAQRVCKRFLILKRGELIEEGEDVFVKPREEYTQKLVEAVKTLNG